MVNALPFEWFVLLLRVLFIFLLYFFLFQVVRVVIREMTMAGTTSGAAVAESAGRLVVRPAGDSGLRPGSVLDLDPVTMIGRHPRATIHIDDGFVSSEHAQVTWSDGRWWLTDLNSTNGTRLNRERVTSPTVLRYGDVIVIGDVELQFAP